jgi:anti-sigma factor RsiW
VSGVHYPDDAVERELIAYALGELDTTQRDRLERRLAGDPELRSRLSDLNATVLALSQLPGEAWAPEQPPPPPALELGPPSSAPAPRPSARRRRGLRSLRGQLALRPFTTAVAAAALVAVGVLAGVAIRSSSGSAATHVIANSKLVPIDNVDPSARAVFALTSEQTARFEVSGLAPTDGRHVYELWLMDSTSDLISIATFRVNAAGHAELTLTLPTAPSHFRYLDVSLQPLDGTALHSSISVLRGATPA